MSKTVSVIIPTYNERDKVLECIKSLRDQSYPASLTEIIVVDDGSEDETVSQIKEKFADVKIIEKKNTGAYDSRNKGLDAATGEIIAFTDSDCISEKNWILNIVKHLSIEDNHIIGGKIKHVNNFLAKAIAVSDFGGYQDSKKKLLDAIPTCNLAAKKQIFDKFRFDSNLKSSGDRLFSWELHKAGYKLKYFPDVVITHNPSVKLSRYFERKYRYGKSFTRIRKNCPTLPGAKFIKYHIFGIIILSIARLFLDIYRLFKTRKENNIKIIELVPYIGLFKVGRFIFMIGGIKEIFKK